MSESKKMNKGSSRRQADSLTESLQEYSVTNLTNDAETVGRRNFLKLAGFGMGSALLSACSEAPVEKAIPFLVAPEEITPGKSLYYASTCHGCSAGCGILIKNRDGRPIKLEGNDLHPLSRGGLCAVGQATLLELYDDLRLKEPLVEGKPTSWQQLDTNLTARFRQLRETGGKLRFLGPTLISPTEQAAVRRFLGSFPDAKWVTFDPLSSSALIQAHEKAFGAAVLPHFLLDQAEVLVSFDADFLGTWISPVEFTHAYYERRRLGSDEPSLSYHVQIESRLSLTGSKADQRLPMSPSEMESALHYLSASLATRAGTASPVSSRDVSSEHSRFLDHLIDRLWQNRGRSLLISSSQDLSQQLLCCFINQLLQNYGATIDLERPSLQKQGNDGQLEALLGELEEGSVAALLVTGLNTACDLPYPDRFTSALQNVSLLVSLSQHLDETAAQAHCICPLPHPLETWSDAEPVRGIVSLSQPAIRPLFQTRPLMESLHAWLQEPTSAYDLIRRQWENELFPLQTLYPSFREFWDHSLHDGFALVDRPPVAPGNFVPAVPVNRTGNGEATSNSLDLVLYSKVSIPQSRHAHNAWLQELPDPLTRVTWENYACLAPETARQLQVEEGELVRLLSDSDSDHPIELELPVVFQPGQHSGIVAVALGYGGRTTERFQGIAPKWLDALPTTNPGGRVGQNSSPFLRLSEGSVRYRVPAVRIEPTGRRRQLARVQTYSFQSVPEHLSTEPGNRPPVVRQMSLKQFHSGNGHAGESHASQGVELWPEDHRFPVHHWGMVIDLSRCTGCGACVVACQAENNIPVVGKDEVRRGREMHWLRIDRYFREGEKGVDVAYQPMLCQQCDHAPCETVCPVLATVHSSEGLNQQIYNRCIGTRYCANNCPYKVRRFNWLDYPRRNPVENLLLNPDVTVRTRGVMEKCTFCIQRIQEARLQARKENRLPLDGEIQLACQQSCPSQAIVFGDMNDPKSRISKQMQSRRFYRVLEELNVRPSVGYLSIVRNRDPEQPSDHHFSENLQTGPGGDR